MSKLKTLHISMALALTFTILLSLTCFNAHCDSIRSNVLRLHILANSDSDYDQRLKLMVRDAILRDCSELFEKVDGYDAAVEQASNNLSKLQQTARLTLQENGCDYPVTVSVGKTDFLTREYEDVTLPAGEYTAVRVLIGNAQGANWWCVCYPNMCFSAASEADEIGKVLDGGDAEIVTQPKKYVVRFKIVEWYQRIKDKLSK